MNENQIKHGENRKADTWYVNGKVNEVAFLKEFSDRSRMRAVNGVIYDGGEHRMEDGAMKQMIVRELSKHVTENLNGRSCSLLSLMRSMWHCEEAQLTDQYIHLSNGTWDTYSDTFSERKEFSTRRLPVDYDLDAPPPEQFLKYAHQLLEEEDVITLQEYLGYCLIPSTKAQKMLVISGKGGEGKSVLGQIMGAMWGDSLIYSSIRKVCTNAFARADLVNRLVLVDDDMSLDALSQTHYLKTLITLNGKTDVERKGEQSVQAPLYARFVGFTNGTLTALYDHSHGFYRRIILLRTKDRPADRVDEPFLAEKIIYSELPGILNWCLQGLDRLFANNYRFTISGQAQKNLTDCMREANPIQDFLESEGYFCLDPNGSISTADLYALFKQYCEENSLIPLSPASFGRQIREPIAALGTVPTNRIPARKSKTIRGYLGIRAMQPPAWIS